MRPMAMGVMLVVVVMVGREAVIHAWRSVEHGTKRHLVRSAVPVYAWWQLRVAAPLLMPLRALRCRQGECKPQFMRLLGNTRLGRRIMRPLLRTEIGEIANRCAPAAPFP